MSTPLGTRRMSFLMNPMGQGDRVINGGNSYANADTIEKAREYAAEVMDGVIEGVTVRAVSIYGRMMELGFSAWREVNHPDPDAQYVSEIVRSKRPAELTARDLLARCYPTTILDYYEIVHEQRSDGSCRCGKHGPDPLHRPASRR